MYFLRSVCETKNSRAQPYATAVLGGLEPTACLPGDLEEALAGGREEKELGICWVEIDAKLDAQRKALGYLGRQ